VRLSSHGHGLNLAIQEPACPLQQNAFYNGWLGGCYASSVYVFAPDGKIVWARGNFPGSFHDSGLQKDYSILTRILPSNHSKRKLILDCCVLLHNFRVSYTDIPNQIRTTFSAGHLRPLFARASIPLQHSMFGIETGASTRDTALNRILHTAQSVRHEGGVPAPDDEL